MAISPLRVLIVDDTILYRKILSDILNTMSELEVVGTAANGKIALDKIKTLKPDLVTLDIEMPVMDGLETLRQIYAQYPNIKTLMVSARSQAGAQITLEALAQGAFDFVTKPTGANWQTSQANLRAQIHAKLAPLIGRTAPATLATAPKPSAPAKALAPTRRIQIVAIGISTGGPKALAQVIPNLPSSFRVPVVIVQHMPAMFTVALAQSLDKASAVSVQEGTQNQTLLPGHVYLAPGGKQMRVVKQGAQVKIDITDDPPENFCKPAVDYLFRSVAEIYGAQTLGIIMTGMGSDGTRGLQTMKAQGAQVIAQDEASSVVYGMPQEAVRANVVDVVLPLEKIAPEIIRICA